MEDEQVLWPSTDSDSNSNSMVSATLGRVMSTLLSARPKKLQDAISRLHSPPKRGSFVTLEESLWILHTYVREAAQREESLDEILVPITQHPLWVCGGGLGADAGGLVDGFCELEGRGSGLLDPGKRWRGMDSGVLWW
ncbi:hypothetical protein TEA_028325 [Camellia sinensis var. sinensis]|uniref:Uncharacterized protein n=1 Tax=Camellia sinensis var. sinensis TaxID=542762 RepID=A0A4S4EQL8_CAMSN|nr:hypothetical protein TEA_028325 [Camellia sinensis var. sinensis]